MYSVYNLVFLVFLTAYPKSNGEKNGDDAFPCIEPFWIGIISEKRLPTDTSDQLESVITPIYKKVDKTDCSIYHGI
jgi:hypothetical protein